MHSKEFVELLGAFTGDGWISKNKKGGQTLVISGNPKDEREYYQRIALLWKKEFMKGIKPRSFSYWGTYGIMCCNPEIIKHFKKAGMQTGRKAAICEVPKAVLDNKELHVPFIRGLFDTDGSTYFKKFYNKNASRWQKSKKHIPTIQFASASISLIKSTKEMLSQLGFNFPLSKYISKHKKWNTMHFLRMTGKINATKFFECIEPKNLRQLTKFEQWLSKGFY